MLNMAIGDPRRCFLKLLHKLLHNLQYYSGANYSADLPTGNLLDMHADRQTSCFSSNSSSSSSRIENKTRFSTTTFNSFILDHFASNLHTQFAMVTKEIDQTKIRSNKLYCTRIPVLVL
jgi:hypothetical protein